MKCFTFTPSSISWFQLMNFVCGTEQGRKKETRSAQGAWCGLRAFTSWHHQAMEGKCFPRAAPATRVVQRQALVGVSCSSPYPISLLLPHRMPSVRTEETSQPNSEHLHPRLARTRLLTSPRWEACVGKGARIRETSQAEKVWGHAQILGLSATRFHIPLQKRGE